MTTDSSQDWVTIALLGKPRGNRGELTAISFSSDPERFSQLKQVFLFGEGDSYAVEEVWNHQGILIFKFQGVDSISAAETLAGSEVRIPRSERISPEEGAYFHSDLIGCAVRDQKSGKVVGAVQSVQDFGPSGLLELDTGLLIPFARAICLRIDLPNREILIDAPEGLLELNQP